VGAHVGDVNPWVGQIDTPNSGVRDGICEVCHTQTLFHRNAVPDPHHNTGATCTSCHPHEAGFDPVGGACTDCHSTAQDNGDGVPPGGRRAVVHEFLFSSHHAQTDPIEDGDCLVCHDQSQHQQGHVRLKNVDDPGNPAAVVSLDGDPAVEPAEAAKLESFCLACHDDDAAGGQPPFSDGILPAVIDAAMWTDAAHRAGGFAGPMTCFGDGKTFGCHATGHGSMKRSLLAPSDASQPPVAGDPLREQEGMCYTCHDADGDRAECGRGPPQAECPCIAQRTSGHYSGGKCRDLPAVGRTHHRTSISDVAQLEPLDLTDDQLDHGEVAARRRQVSRGELIPMQPHKRISRRKRLTRFGRHGVGVSNVKIGLFPVTLGKLTVPVEFHVAPDTQLDRVARVVTDRACLGTLLELRCLGGSSVRIEPQAMKLRVRTTQDENPGIG
jgi:hypothetical protein